MNGIICQVINKLKHILFQHKHSPVAHLNFFKNIQKVSNGPIAHLPNNTQVQASHKGTLHLHDDISSQASEVLIFPHLKNESLLSIGQLCDDNCIVIFTKENFA